MASPRQPPAVIVATPKSQHRQEPRSPGSSAKTVAFVNPSSWVWSLRAEKAKEPRQNKLDTGLNGALPVLQEDRLPGGGYELTSKDAQELKDAMSMLRKALTEEQKVMQSDTKQQASEQPLKLQGSSTSGDQLLGSGSAAPGSCLRAGSPAERQTLGVSFRSDFGDITPSTPRTPSRDGFSETLRWWKSWDSRRYGESRDPAWREDPNGLTKPSGSPRRASSQRASALGPDEARGLFTNSPRSRVPRTRTWKTEMQVQRQLATINKDLPQSAAALDTEVLLRSKSRLQRMIRAGQTSMVRQEMRASLHVKTNIFTVQAAKTGAEGGADRESKIPRKDAKRHAHSVANQNSEAMIALRVMSQQRNELSKARRAMADVVEQTSKNVANERSTGNEFDNEFRKTARKSIVAARESDYFNVDMEAHG